MTDNPITDRLLPERCFLNYVYLGSESPIFKKLPFYSNIDISESRKPSYDIKQGANEAESTYNFVRIDNRKIDLNFDLNLNHFIETNSIFNYQNTETNEDKKELDKQKFSIGADVEKNEVPYSRELLEKYSINETVYNSYGDSYNYYKNKTYKKQFSVFPRFSDPFTPPLPPELLEPFINTYYTTGISPNKERLEEDILNAFFVKSLRINDDLEIHKQLDAFIYLINVLRSGVLFKDGQTGVPPIIFLNYGVLYQNIPCLCLNYDIKIQQDSPYELGSLLPHHLRVSMSLVEARDYITDKINEDANLRQQLNQVYSVVDNGNKGWSSVVNKPYSIDISPETNIVID
jgi:hypothetical protein